MTMKPSPEIEKCPWCGATAMCLKVQDGPLPIYGVGCIMKACQSRGPIAHQRVVAMARWNRVSSLAKRSTRGKGKREQA